MSKKDTKNQPATTAAPTPPPPPAPEAPPVATAKCASCDAALDEALIKAGKDICALCEEKIDGPREEPDAEADLVDEEVDDAMPTLPAGVMEAAEAFGLAREHVFTGRVTTNGKGGSLTNILTQGGKRVRREVERDGRVILHGPDGVRWVQSAVGGYVARDEQGKVMRNESGGVLRISGGHQLLHSRDRGEKQQEQSSLYSNK